MGRLAEQRLWDSLKRHWPTWSHIERVENVVVDGMPDVHGMMKKIGSFWIELKAPSAPARDSTRLLGKEGLSPAQQNWFLRARLHGARAFILVRDDQRNVYFIPAKHADYINDMTAAQLAAVSIADSLSAIPEIIEGYRE